MDEELLKKCQLVLEQEYSEEDAMIRRDDFTVSDFILLEKLKTESDVEEWFISVGFAGSNEYFDSKASEGGDVSCVGDMIDGYVGTDEPKKPKNINALRKVEVDTVCFDSCYRPGFEECGVVVLSTIPALEDSDGSIFVMEKDWFDLVV